MSTSKSQMFLQPEQKIFDGCEKSVDKASYICLNVNNIGKDFDGKFVFLECLSESRWLVKTGVVERADLIPESVV